MRLLFIEARHDNIALYGQHLPPYASSRLRLLMPFLSADGLSHYIDDFVRLTLRHSLLQGTRLPRARLV